MNVCVFSACSHRKAADLRVQPPLSRYLRHAQRCQGGTWGENHRGLISHTLCIFMYVYLHGVFHKGGHAATPKSSILFWDFPWNKPTTWDPPLKRKPPYGGAIINGVTTISVTKIGLINCRMIDAWLIVSSIQYFIGWVLWNNCRFDPIFEGKTWENIWKQDHFHSRHYLVTAGRLFQKMCLAFFIDSLLDDDPKYCCSLGLQVVSWAW